MTGNHREPRLPRGAEELLQGWPAPSRGALAWEETASAVMTRVRETTLGSTPDDLLAPPLPEEPDEAGRTVNQGAAVSDASPANEPSLADIARAALAASQAATREVARDGLIAAELGRKLPPREPPKATRAVLDAAGLQGRIVRVPDAPAPPPSVVKPVPQLAEVAAEPAPARITEAAARSEFPAPPSREVRRSHAAAFAGSALALAAAAALYLSFTHREAKDALVTASAETPQAVARREAPSTVAEAPAAAPGRTEPEPSPAASAASIDDGQLAAAKSRPSSVIAPKEKSLAFHVKKESAANEGKLVLEEREDPASENAPPPAQAAAPPPPPPPAQGLVERPSTGAVQAAFGSVLTSARSCLAGQDSGPRATVTFDGATGRVKSVTLAGTGAGSPAESCVRSALMGARLPPFSEPTFTASVTVRPL